ncbi:MAG: M48 family metalloprotease, partial [Blastocatellia bacterium]|nr:M48 family metalloprotease [Blastocatellia bacterium]
RRLIRSFLALTLISMQLSCRGGLEAPPGSRSSPKFKPGFNLFSPQQDVQLGLQSARQIMSETPMLKDPQINGYITQLGEKLAAKTAGEKFPYQFQVVATREINAFALPGGFLFVNAGAIAAAHNEGELAGVMAHEIAHVELRHGTNQASKQQVAKAGIGILGTIASGGENSNLGQAVNAIGGLGANMLFLKFGRGAEKEADLEGARIMTEAGYDPRDMANFFKTLESKGGQRVPEMLSDHPDPGNRTQYILEEVKSLPLSRNPVHTTKEFEQIKARLTGTDLSAASQLHRIGEDPGDLELRVRPQKPSASFKAFQARDGSFALQAPSNWDLLSNDGSNYIFAPKGAYGKFKDSMMVTHGIFVGIVPLQQSDLRAATEAFIRQQIETNDDFGLARSPQQVNFGGMNGYVSIVSGPSAISGVVEVDTTYTAATDDGRMLYLITIAPEDELASYQAAFQQILRSLRVAR